MTDYVAGFISWDDDLGQTIYCSSFGDAVKCINKMLKRNNRKSRDKRYWSDNYSLTGSEGTYFIGLLESANEFLRE